MAKSEAYLFYEAGQAVAAVHLKLSVRHVCGNPAEQATEIVIPRGDAKSRIILWLTGMAAEKKGVGRSDPLRRMRNRMRMQTLTEDIMKGLKGSPSRRRTRAKQVLNQAQDRANSICAELYDAIARVVAELRKTPTVGGKRVEEIVAKVKQKRRAQSQAK